MKNLFMSILFILTLSLLLSCDEGGTKAGDGAPEDSTSGNSASEGITMLAKVEEIGDRITVSVLESEYTSGPHWVITSDETEYYDCNNTPIKRIDVSVGDTVEILYSGQVMMSYPPQIVAKRITVK